MGKTYVVINFGEDGISIRELSKPDLEEKLNDDWWGDNPTFLEKVPEDIDRADGLLILDGGAILPEEVKTVKEWKLP